MNKYERFRDIHGLNNCIRCGDKPSPHHHYYCEKCWKYHRLDEIATIINENAMEELSRKTIELSL